MTNPSDLRLVPFIRLSTLIFVALPLLVSYAHAQEIETQISADQGPYFVGLPMTIQVTASGVSDRGEPEITVDRENDDLRWSLVAKNPTRIRFNNNGRIITQAKDDFVFRFTAKKPGQFEIGPFTVIDGSVKQQVDSVKITFEEVPTTDGMKIHLKLPKGPFFPEQRVPVEIEWWYSGELSNAGISISSPLFDQFTFQDEKQSNVGQTILPIDTEKGSVDLVAGVREERIDGKLFRVFSAKRIMIPDRVGTYEIDPIEVVIRRRIIGQRQRRDDSGFGFGLFDRVETYLKGVEAFRAVGEPKSITIGGFPTTGKPASFAGAVGQGFSIDVSADRTVVRVGDPIRLNVRLRGNGNLENTILPPLSADNGLDPKRFRLPTGDVTGELSQGEKNFSVSVRVEDESVSEIPAIAYSWFDTDAKEYRTTRSKPIALRVMPATVVGAQDVVSSSKMPTKNSAIPQANKVSDSTSGSVARSTIQAHSGADLAIFTDPALLLSKREPLLGGTALQTGSYVVGVALFVLALVDRRRNQIDPEVHQAARHAKQQLDRIIASASKPQKEAAAEIAAALRSLLANHPDRLRAETQSLISQCESLIYQPDSEQTGVISPELVEQAKELAERFRKAAK